MEAHVGFGKKVLQILKKIVKSIMFLKTYPLGFVSFL